MARTGPVTAGFSPARARPGAVALDEPRAGKYLRRRHGALERV
jgi:hypothetical protein